MTNVTVEILKKYNANLPKYSTEFSAGFDLEAYIDPIEITDYISQLNNVFKKVEGLDFLLSENKTQITILPGKSIAVPTGLFVSVPIGYELQVRPRSGMAIKEGLMVINSPGTVDPDYRGEIMILVYNSSSQPITIKNGMRIAQGVIAPYIKGEFKLVETLSPTVRGKGGFGHTGKY